MKKLTKYNKKSLLLVLMVFCAFQVSFGQNHKRSEKETTSLAIFPDDYDDDSTKSTPKSYQDKGPCCIFGLEIGANIANLNFTAPENTYKNGFTVAGRFGGILDIALSRHFFIEPGLFSVVNGTNLGIDSYIPEHVYVYTAELPVNVLYKLGNARGNRFFFGLGGYIGYNIGGTISNSTSSIYPADIKIGNSKGDFVTPFDFGAGINAGYQLKDGIFFRARYQVGLANLSPNTDNGRFIRSSSFGAQVGYFFRNAKKS